MTCNFPTSVEICFLCFSKAKTNNEAFEETITEVKKFWAMWIKALQVKVCKEKLTKLWEKGSGICVPIASPYHGQPTREALTQSGAEAPTQLFSRSSNSISGLAAGGGGGQQTPSTAHTRWCMCVCEWLSDSYLTRPGSDFSLWKLHEIHYTWTLIRKYQ